MKRTQRSKFLRVLKNVKPMHSNENFHIIESLGLVIVSHNNLLNQDSVGNIITKIKSNPFFKEEYFILIDIRNAKIELDSEEIENLSDFVYDNLKDTGLKKFAIIASESQLNKAVGFVRSYKHSSKFQIFSNIEAALYWLKKPQQNKEQIEIKINYLRHFS